LWGISFLSDSGPEGITLGSAIEIMLTVVLIPALYLLINTLLAFTAAQFVQAVSVGCLVRRVGKWANLATILVLPISATLTWYSLDYLAGFDLPLPRGPEPAGWVPYEHGLTVDRYLKAMASQAPVTPFNIAYAFTETGGRARRAVVALAAIMIGVVIFGFLFSLAAPAVP
jgi:hypothetical protein